MFGISRKPSPSNVSVASVWPVSQFAFDVFGMNGGSCYYNRAQQYANQHGGANGNNFIYYTVREIA